MTNRQGGHPQIVSLLPSVTEWIYALRLAEHLVGVSHECDYPNAVSTIPRVTRSRIQSTESSAQIDQTVREHSDARAPLFDLDDEILLQLSPDLIFTQTLCNVCAVNESDVQRYIDDIESECQLINLQATSFASVLEDAVQIIQATGRRTESFSALRSLRKRIENTRADVDDAHSRPSVTLLEWSDPLYCSGHWTPELIEWAGGYDPIGRVGQPSRQIRPDDLSNADPDILLVACCGLSQHRCVREVAMLMTHDWFAELKCVRNNQVHVFDGSAWFNRPGPRLVDALEAVSELIRRWRD